MSSPPVIFKSMKCPVCGRRNELWEGAISRLEDAARQASEIECFEVKVDFRQDCGKCYPLWMADMGLEEADELEQWQKDLGMKVYRMEKDEHDFRQSRDNHLRERGFYLTLVVSHESLPEPARVFLDSNDATLFCRLLKGSQDGDLSLKRQHGVECSKLEKWYLELKQRLAERRHYTEHTVEPKELDFDF